MKTLKLSEEIDNTCVSDLGTIQPVEQITVNENSEKQFINRHRTKANQSNKRKGENI